MTSASTPQDLKVGLTCLSSSIRAVMLSWYGVQKTSCQSSLLRNSVTPLRNYLQTQWTDILGFLQMCYNFGADAVLWQKAVETGSETGPLLEDLAFSSDELVKKCEDLIRQSDSNMECLSSITPQLSELFRASRANTASGLYSYLEKLPRTISFLGRASFSDGLVAIRDTESGLAEIRTSLCMMHQFWIVVSETCHSFMKVDAHVPLELVQQVGETWKQYQQHVVGGKVSIAQSLDALSVEPAPIIRRQPRRRGSSKSDASIPASPSIVPRRMSNLGDGGVLNACWGWRR
ncbi:hypothetical protein B0H15DRAFT_354990 [Mycena belliarum]|uniref:Uncharacterized protein n=1 Tax=Mycena belliarum TaxID=1033014 RepID=A0AAD6U1V6_9AGAR|nr:hypothetical protein B0H15DRAFT_354990 [Mycena belliae]